MGLKNIIKFYKESNSFWAGLLRDFLFVLAVVIIFASVSKIALGLYTPMVAVESGSMIPHIQIGDIIFIESAQRAEIITNEAGKEMDYSSFSDMAMSYYTNLKEKRELHNYSSRHVLCRKRRSHVDERTTCPYAGYITKGDNSKTNAAYDQQGSISYLQPIKKEWVIGKAIFTGYLFLDVFPLFQEGILHVLSESRKKKGIKFQAYNFVSG